jgi:ribonuclease P protein component
MLSRKNRVKREQFERLQSTSALYHSPYFSLRIKKNDSEAPFTFATVVSKKVAKTSAQRNLLKRRIKNVAEEIISPLPSTSSILFLKKDGAALSFALLKKEIENLYKKIQIR